MMHLSGCRLKRTGSRFHAFLLLLTVVDAQYDINTKVPEHIPEDQFTHFVSRPDIHAPKWSITVYDKLHITPGYWFTAPYEQIGADPPNPSWVGPQIFDSDGSLIWSSGSLFETANTFDFRVAKVNGSEWMTVIDTYAESAFLLDDHYEVREKRWIGKRGKTINMHDFNLVDDGNHALLLHRNITTVPEDMVQAFGYEGKCRVMSQAFEEKDTTTDEWDTVFWWNTVDHIALNESTMHEHVCKLWDYLHCNSIDKCPDGHYLLSARHADTIFKISKDDGSILWRLGGTQSDFESNFRFSRQHHIRCRAQNATHTTVSFLDNAKGGDSMAATNDYSRGLIVSLETMPQSGSMQAKVLSEFVHPDHGYNEGRGNCEMLEGGNVWMGWSDRSLQSEHTPDGTMVLKAVMVPNWLRSYRSYKYQWVGRPRKPPDVVAAAEKHKRGVRTRAHVSWNGATGVAYWNMYRSDREGVTVQLIAAAPSRGFETELLYDGFASYVVLEALDSNGQAINNGRSSPFKTTEAPVMKGAAVTKEVQWQQQATYEKDHPWLATAKSTATKVSSKPAGLFFAGATVSAVIALSISFCRSFWRKKGRWWIAAARLKSRDKWQDGDKDESKPMFDQDHDEGNVHGLADHAGHERYDDITLEIRESPQP